MGVRKPKEKARTCIDIDGYHSKEVGKFQRKTCKRPSLLSDKWLVQNTLSDLAQAAGIDPAFIGYVESSVYLESISSYLKAEDCSLDEFPDEIRGAIRIMDKEGNITFLASDHKSLINKMVDFTSNTLDIFVLGNVEADKAESLKQAILSKTKNK